MRLRHLILTLIALTAFAGSARAATGFSANLVGSQEVPPVATAATGSAVLVLNDAGTQATVAVQFQNLIGTYTGSHIHGYAAPGANAGVRFGFSPTLSNGNRNGVFNGVWNLTATDATNLINGLCYVNIHSTSFPGGEIRGQLTVDSATPNAHSTWGRIKKLYRR